MSGRKSTGTAEAVSEEMKEAIEQDAGMPEQKEADGQDVEKPEQEEVKGPVKVMITAPNENYYGKIGGVCFAAGRAELEVNDENTRMLNWFRDNGYEVSYI